MSREATILRNRRQELKLTQQDVALETGMHIRQYQRYEYDESDIGYAPVKYVLRLCLTLELDPYELIFADSRDVAGK